jgi:multisubunit Na+/H+ antiporter MnhE subunit
LPAATRIAGSRRRTYLSRVVLPWLLLWATSFVLMLLYVGKIATDELIAAAAGSAVAATASRIVLATHVAPLAAQWRAVAQIWRLPKYVVTGTWEVLAVLARQMFLRRPAQSLFHAIPFDVGANDDESAMRRALAIAYTTATPNFVVVGIDREKGLLVYHQIQHSPIPEMTKRLGARP